MKIAFFNMEKWEEKILKDTFKSHTLSFFKKKLSKGLAKKVKDTEVLASFVDTPLDKPMLDLFPKLKFITTMSTGFDHIDLEECKKRGIWVSNVPTYGENTVAQHAMALLLAISRRIVESVDRTRHGIFDYKGLRGFDLMGKTLGVIGAGNIGKHTVQMAHGFGMKIMAFDPHPNRVWGRKYDVKFVTMEKLLKDSDAISLHVPLNPHTKHLLNKKNMKLLKKGVVLINTARGGLIETEALIKGLNSGQIGWAGLDTLEAEPELKEGAAIFKMGAKDHEELKLLAQDHLLFHHPRVLITPHSAFNSQGAIERILGTTIKNIKGYIAKRRINSVMK